MADPYMFGFISDTKLGPELRGVGWGFLYIYLYPTPGAITSYCGAMPNYYNQRVRSWDFAEHMLTFKFIRLFFKSYIRGSPLRTLVMKAFQTYVLYSIYADWIKVPVFVYLSRSPRFFLFCGLGEAEPEEQEGDHPCTSGGRSRSSSPTASRTAWATAGPSTPSSRAR